MKVLFAVHNDGSYEVFTDDPNIEITVVDDTVPDGDAIRDDQWDDLIDDLMARYPYCVVPDVIEPERI